MTKVEVKCSNCGETVSKLIKYINAATKIGKTEFFCNNKCASNFRNHQIISKCKNCSKEIRKSKSATARSKTGNCFCSRKCATIVNNTLFKSRENNPNWINGKGSYRSMVNINECSCGCKLKFLLLVHHKDGNRSNNDISNLEVVCPTCHSLRHIKEINGELIVDHRFITTQEVFEKLKMYVGA